MFLKFFKQNVNWYQTGAGLAFVVGFFFKWGSWLRRYLDMGAGCRFEDSGGSRSSLGDSTHYLAALVFHKAEGIELGL